MPFRSGIESAAAVTRATAASSGALSDVMDRMSSAFALTRGPTHVLSYANAAFRSLLSPNLATLLERPLVAILELSDGAPLLALLDRAFRSGVPVRAQRVSAEGRLTSPMTCSVWPTLAPTGQTESLLIELRSSTREESTFTLQREIAERLLESALREQLSAENAESSRRSATFLADESRRLSMSLDEDETIEAIKRTALPHAGSWCVVDILAQDNSMQRLAVIHPDSAKQATLAALEGRWTPDPHDPFGLPAAMRAMEPARVAGDVAPTVASAAHPADVVAALQSLAVGPSLLAPLRIGDRLIGAITFIAADAEYDFTEEDVRLANELADRSAAALDRARRYGESLALRQRAESANVAKSTFLGMMSHELRTPLNAIAGYVDLIDMELHGPVTDAQRKDLDRIRTSQRYLTGLINDLLSLTKVSSGQVAYHTADIDVYELVDATRSLVAPLITQRNLAFDHARTDKGLIARGDRDRVVQILVNLLSNAIKFTPHGGKVRVECSATPTTVIIRVHDSGIGIPEDKLERIFEPFVQLDGSTLGPESGVGLGLAISRALARAMHGDLVAERSPSAGATLALTLPRANEPITRSV